MNIATHLHAFLSLLKEGTIDIYNEAGLQHELAIHLRPCADEAGYLLELERNTSHFGLTGLLKSEMDIVVYPKGRPSRHTARCIELKVPLQGAVPERMFQFAIDLAYLESLRAAGFPECAALMVTDDHNFWNGAAPHPLYASFRAGAPLTGTVVAAVKRSGLQSVSLRGSHRLRWEPLFGAWRYLLVSV